MGGFFASRNTPRGIIGTAGARRTNTRAGRTDGRTRMKNKGAALHPKRLKGKISHFNNGYNPHKYGISNRTTAES